MKTIFRFIATTILLTVSYLSFGQSPQRHKIQDPIIFYRQLSIALTRETAALAYNVVADDDSFAATQLTSSDFTPALTFALKAQNLLISRIGHMQYVEEIYDDFYKPERSNFQQLFIPIYIWNIPCELLLIAEYRLSVEWNIGDSIKKKNNLLLSRIGKS